MLRAEAVDLRQIPVVDNHCHGILRSQRFDDLMSWRGAFTGCEPHEVAVLAVRKERDEAELTGALLRAANIETLLIDTGHPPPEEVLPGDEFGRLGGCRTEPMLRLETLMERLLAEHDSLSEVKEALADALDDVRGQGYVALKSIVAYRTGLDVQEWTGDEAEASLREFRRAAGESSAWLAHKPLLDTLLHLAFAEAARQEVPVQFHVGYGDADTNLLLGNPLHLRAVLERSEYRSMPVVLLHECYPYTREGGYLAAVYENVYLDLSYGIPLLGYGELLSFTREALGVAPISKLLYSSDGIGVPELHWMSAIDGRHVLGLALEELVAHDELSIPEAEAAGEDVLRRNAIRLYQLSSG
ncbi:MAG: amidohydrolase family protein [Actinobacteria bacterium]|nr:amidohydrolase family protein [Actinomycetota bacterium]